MTVSNALYNRLEDEFRREFVYNQDQSVKNLIADYFGAYEYLGDVIATSQGYRDGNINSVINDLTPAFEQSRDVIYNNFGTEYELMRALAVNSIITPLTIGGISLDLLTRNAINTSTVQSSRYLYTDPMPSDGMRLSERIWKPKTQKDIIDIVNTGIKSGDSSSNVANNIVRYSRTTGYKDALRLAFTEMTKAYSTPKVYGARGWNNSEQSMFKIGIKQELSPAHPRFDICDLLKGTYDPDGAIPAIPRHPNCMCIERQVILKGNATTINNRLKNATYDNFDSTSTSPQLLNVNYKIDSKDAKAKIDLI